MKDFMKLLSKLECLQEQCAYSKCSCQSHTDQNPLKACAACGIISYCSKKSQTKDWPRHKTMCSKFKPWKAQVGTLNIQQKQALNHMSLHLPNIAHEYKKKFSHEFLQNEFVRAGMLSTQEMVSSNLPNLFLEKESTQDFLKRWQEYSPEMLDFIDTAQPGDVFEQKSYHPYAPGAPQQFRNTPLAEPGVLVNGTTVVDFGFVDFGMTFDSIDSVDIQGDPITVLGFDSDPFCVAKSMVMIAMMEDTDVAPRSVVEVWLSSLWSKKTFNAFKRATRCILNNTNPQLDNQVKAIIVYWNKFQKMNSKAALQLQFQAVLKECDTKFAMKACSLDKEEDRVEFLRYFLTKAFYEDATTTVGSIVMNSIHPDIGVKQIFESCLEAAPARIHHLHEPISLESLSFIGRTKLYFENNMKKFMDHIRNKSLIFIPKLGTVGIGNKAMIEQVKMAKPHTISWSNVVDYIHPREFHHIAKSMSCEDTVHYIHSCNWTSRVYGTDIYDLHTDGRLHFFSAGMLTIEHSHTLLKGFTGQGVNHFRDVCTTILARTYVHKFFAYFFRDQDVNCACFNGNTPLKMAYPFSRCVSTAFVIFAYSDTGIDFGQDTYDLTRVYWDK